MAVTGLRAFFQDPKRNPKRSYTAVLAEKANKPTYWQRLAGVYRIYTGRINSPKTVTKSNDNGAEVFTESPSLNHAGVYDYVTGGVLNAVESFASGNWIETPARRNVWKFFLSPIWLPLNLLRAAFGVVATLLSAIPMIGVHVNQIKKQNATEAAAQQQAEQQREIRKKADELKPGNVVAVANASPTMETQEPKAKVNQRVSKAVSQIVPRKSREALNEQTFDKSGDENPDAFRKQLLASPVESPNAYWKVTETNKEIKAKLVEGKAKHPERYSNVVVALPKGIKKSEAAAEVQSRINNTIGALPQNFNPATVKTDGDTIAVESKASKKERKPSKKNGGNDKPKKSLGNLFQGKTKTAGLESQKSTSRFSLFNRANANAEAKTPGKTVSAIIPAFHQ